MNYKLAFALGLIAPGTVGREPVAWLYNGVVLPNINTVYTPEIQKTHPYAMIWGQSWVYKTYYLMLCTEPIVVCADGNINYPMPYLSSNISPTTANPPWGELTIIETDTEVESDAMVWSNHNILNEDGTVCLAASDPIPVYE